MDGGTFTRSIQRLHRLEVQPQSESVFYDHSNMRNMNCENQNKRTVKDCDNINYNNQTVKDCKNQNIETVPIIENQIENVVNGNSSVTNMDCTDYNQRTVSISDSCDFLGFEPSNDFIGFQ